MLAGDARGQVNLLAVLALLVFLPALSLLLTGLALLRRKSWLPPGWWQHLPLLPAGWKQALHRHRLQGAGFWWLLLAGQWLMLGFSLGSVLALALLLLFTDLHFVWRSTVLQAEHLEPLLRALAWPWSFWDTAQPSLELLRQTRGDRLVPVEASAPLARWWPFLLAAQLSYVVMPRLLLALWASRHLRQRPVHPPHPGGVEQPPATTLAESVRQWPAESQWLDAAWLPEELAGQLPAIPRPADAWPAPESLSGVPLVVIVRAWEPPLAELADRLRGFQGLILPLDWSEGRWREPRATHLQEWRRFTAELPGWKVLTWP